mgnify:CR=1 FL=1
MHPLNAHDVRPRSTRALIVDDNEELRELLGGYLSRFNIDSQAVGDGQGMRQALAQGHFDVIILDLMLPGEDGLVLCRELRSQSDIPILMLTARCEPTDRIIGLELRAARAGGTHPEHPAAGPRRPFRATARAAQQHPLR